MFTLAATTIHPRRPMKIVIILSLAWLVIILHHQILGRGNNNRLVAERTTRARKRKIESESEAEREAVAVVKSCK